LTLLNHLEKFERGYDKIINIWGADHHGYITRVKASIQALGHNPDKLEILLVQFANLGILNVKHRIFISFGLC
jgi:arginyl-tRNA synthetase